MTKKKKKTRETHWKMEKSNRENNKDHISQSRGSALDGEEHIGEWRNPIGKIKNITLPSQEGPLLTVKTSLENGGIQSGK